MDIRVKWIFKTECSETKIINQKIDINCALYKHMKDMKDRLFFSWFASEHAKTALERYATEKGIRKENVIIKAVLPYGFTSAMMNQIHEFRFYAYSINGMEFIGEYSGFMRIVDALWMLSTSTKPMIEKSRYEDIIIDSIESRLGLTRGTTYIRIDQSSIREALKDTIGEKDLVSLFRINLRNPI